MSEQSRPIRAVAKALVTHAGSVLPAGRAKWARAMRNELDYIPGDVAALRWAVGCVSACYAERIGNMVVRHMKAISLSRVVLTLEMLLCFVPPTGLLLVALWSVVAGGLVFGESAFPALWVASSPVGPAGLYFAFRSIVLEQREISRAGASALGVLGAWAFVGNLYAASVLASPGYAWRGIVLWSILPALGTAHLILLATASKRRQMAAA